MSAKFSHHAFLPCLNIIFEQTDISEKIVPFPFPCNSNSALPCEQYPNNMQ